MALEQTQEEITEGPFEYYSPVCVYTSQVVHEQSQYLRTSPMRKETPALQLLRCWTRSENKAFYRIR